MKIKILKISAKILLTVLLILSLLFSLVSVFFTLAFSVERVEKKLKSNGFYDLGYAEFTDSIVQIQNVVNIDTDSLLAAVPETDISKLLTDYTHALNLQLIEGADNVYTPEYSSDAVRRLVNENISEDSYGEYTELVELDREYAYNDIISALTGTVSFFPASLYDKAVSFVGKYLSLAEIYGFVRLAKKCLIPSLAAAVICIAGLILLQRKKVRETVKYVASVLFFFSSVLFLPVLFLSRVEYINRLSVADGLLREYITTVYFHFGESIFVPTAALFIFSAVFLIITIVISSMKKSSDSLQ